MKIFLVKKTAGRRYDSADIVKRLLCAELSHGTDGEPVLSDGRAVSISHTKHWWAAAAADAGEAGALGFDMEELSRVPGERIAQKLHPLEREYLSGLQSGSGEWRGELLGIWTAKESYMKMCSEGLSMGLASFSAISPDLACAETVSAEGRPRGRLIRLSPRKELTACLCVPDSGCRLNAEDIDIRVCGYDGRPSETAADCAARLLSAGDLSSAELSAKLRRKGYPEDECEAALALMKDCGYVDDEAFAQRLGERLAASGKGRLYIASQLKKRGLPFDVNAYEDPRERERAMEAALDALGGADLSSADPKERERLLAKAARRLASRGYTAEVIYSVLAKLR